MTIDKETLKAMAECAVGFTDMSLAPDVVLALLAEIERIELISRISCNHDGFKAVLDERDQLKAENEALRKHIQEGIGLMPLGTAKRAAWVVSALGSTPMAKEANRG